MALCKDIDDFNKFIVGKSKQEIHNALYDVIRKRRSFILQLLQIHKLDILVVNIMIHMLAIRSQSDSLMYLIDTYDQYRYSEYVCMYLVRTIDIPEHYITKFIHKSKQRNKYLMLYACDRYTKNRLMVLIHSFDWKMQLDIAKQCSIGGNTTKCFFICALEHIDELTITDIDDLIEHLCDVYGPVQFYINALCKFADKFPLPMYKRIDTLYTRTCVGFDSNEFMVYSIGILSIETLNANIPDMIVCVDHYYALINAHVSMIKLVPAVINSIYNHRLNVSLIIRHMYEHGNSLFKHIDIDKIKKKHNFMTILETAMEHHQYDVNALNMLRSISCIKKIARIHKRDYHECNIIEQVLEI